MNSEINLKNGSVLKTSGDVSATSKGDVKVTTHAQAGSLPISLGITAVAGTLTNTVLVLTAIQFTGDWINVYANLQAIVQNVYGVLISVNGVIELVAAVILVPALYLGTEKAFKNRI